MKLKYTKAYLYSCFYDHPDEENSDETWTRMLNWKICAAGTYKSYLLDFRPRIKGMLKIMWRRKKMLEPSIKTA